jgi:hypothetical protein
VGLWWIVVLFGAGLLAARLFWYWQVKDLRARLRKKEDVLYHLNRSLTDSRLQGLRTKLNPHFLFNTLNGLRGSMLISARHCATKRSASCFRHSI